MMSASELTWLQTEFRNNRSRQALADAQSLQDLQNARAAESIASHLSGDDHKVIVSAMRAAATAGAGQVQMIRFPSAACTDLGRRINSAQPGWGSTLQGRPADIYRFWETELRPQGFRIVAQVLEFPKGKPGDIGLSVVWGE
jgi:hypothetical protein